MPDLTAQGGATFSFGAMTAAPLAPHIAMSPAAAVSAAAALAASDSAANALRNTLLADVSEHASDLA
eukprot:5033968-Pleurochrysis_carterae.AAC.1